MTPTIELRPGLDDEEAGFVGSILNAPDDDTARKAFADWLDEHARPVEAKYLREIRRHKFVRLVRRRGWWALYPEWARVMPPPVQKYGNQYDSQPPLGHPLSVPLSDRCAAWIRKIERGWEMPGWAADGGWSMRARYFGVYDWEYLHIIDPLVFAHSRR